MLLSYYDYTNGDLKYASASLPTINPVPESDYGVGVVLGFSLIAAVCFLGYMNRSKKLLLPNAV